jgi:uncharacterized membrane protein AbrB (regulator of aidB expression)
MLFKQSTFKAQISLLLLAVLLAACVAKNFGVSLACPSAQLAESQPLSGHEQQSCQFAEQLLKQHVQTLEQEFVVVLFIALAFVTLSHLGPIRDFLKPTIPPPRRMHRLVCHFRE